MPNENSKNHKKKVSFKIISMYWINGQVRVLLTLRGFRTVNVWIINCIIKKMFGIRIIKLCKKTTIQRKFRYRCIY